MPESYAGTLIGFERFPAIPVAASYVVESKQMSSALPMFLWTVLSIVQDDPTPRLATPIAPEKAWELADDFSAWSIRLLSEGRHEELRKAIETAIEKLPKPYGDQFKPVFERCRAMLSEPESYTAEQRRAHAALERIRLFRMLGGFKELIEAIKPELKRDPKMWESLGRNRISRDGLLYDLGWAYFRTGEFGSGIDAYGQVTRPAAPEHLASLKNRLEESILEDHPILAALRWLRRELMLAEKPDRWFRLYRRLMGALSIAGDWEGFKAVEGALLKNPNCPPGIAVETLNDRAGSAYSRGDFAEYVKILGDVLKTYPKAPQYHDVLLARARGLILVRRHEEARLACEEWLRAFDGREMSGGEEMIRISKGMSSEVQQLLAWTREAEGRWEEAYRARLDARDKRPRESFCGTCAGSLRMEDQLNVARCLARVGKPDEALAIIDKYKTHANLFRTPSAVRAIVEASSGGAREAEFRKAVAEAATRHAGDYFGKSAAKYFDVYKAERDADASGLLRILSEELPNPAAFFRGNPADRWEQHLAHEGWVGSEALDRLIRLQDKAIPILVDAITKEGAAAGAAMIALAHISHPEAMKLLADPTWIPKTQDEVYVEACRRISMRWRRD